MDSDLLGVLAILCLAYGLVRVDDETWEWLVWTPFILAGTLGVAAFMTG